MGRGRVVIFARAPRLGAVKRRLAKEVGGDVAWRFYRRTLDAVTRRLAADPRWHTALAVTPDSARLTPAPWLPGVPRRAQGPGDLGARMARAIRALAPGPVVIVGSDVPDIGPAQVAAAFAALGRHDAVFGPSPDGGYWLIGWRGRRSLPSGALEDVRWSGAHARADSMASLGPGVSIALVDELEDVDNAESYARWRMRVDR